MTTFGVVGVGASGAPAVTALARRGDVVVYDSDPDRARRIADDHPRGHVGVVSDLRAVADRADVVVLATPAGVQHRAARRLLRDGCHVVSMADDAGLVDELLELDPAARTAGRSMIVGAGLAPGVVDVLAMHAAALMTAVDTITIAKTGTGGPACARTHHAALKRPGREWVDGEWVDRIGGTGRELAWFPDPIGARDCYRAALPGPTLLHRVFPDARRITARVSATRRDRFTSRLPMLRPPHADGGPGAVRVEVRGWGASGADTIVYGLFGWPSQISGTMAALVAERLASADVEPGAAGVMERFDAADLLRSLGDAGFEAVAFEGAGGR